MFPAEGAVKAAERAPQVLTPQAAEPGQVIK